MTFWSCRKNGLIRKLRLTTKVMTSLTNISRSKDNQTMKLGQLIEYNKRNIFFFKNYVESEAGRLVLDLVLFFKKAQQPSTWHTIKTNCIKPQTIDPEIYSTFFFQKWVWEQLLHHILCMIFQEKCFSCYIQLIDQISLYDCPYFSKYWAIIRVLRFLLTTL